MTKRIIKTNVQQLAKLDKNHKILRDIAFTLGGAGISSVEGEGDRMVVGLKGIGSVKDVWSGREVFAEIDDEFYYHARHLKHSGIVMTGLSK